GDEDDRPAGKGLAVVLHRAVDVAALRGAAEKHRQQGREGSEDDGPHGNSAHQSLPRVSSPEGVQAAHQASGETLDDRNFTLPSPRPTRMPDVRGADASRGSHVLVELPQVGADWNFDAVPVTW